MLSLPSSARLFVATDVGDGPHRLDSLMMLVRDVLGQDVFAGHLSSSPRVEEMVCTSLSRSIYLDRAPNSSRTHSPNEKHKWPLFRVGVRCVLGFAFTHGHIQFRSSATTFMSSLVLLESAQP